MDDLLSEKEQIEKMRAWWSDYGAYVISGIVLGALVLFGMNYYQTRTLEAQQAASTLYDTLADHVAEGRLEESESVIAEIVADHAESPYAAQAKLALARLYMDKNRDQDAADTLRELMDGAAKEEFRLIARVRLAKILLYQNKAGEVVELLADQPQEGAFAARVAETLGDAYVALDQLEDARLAYQVALSEPNQAATVDQQFVQLKLMDLPLGAFATEEDDVASESGEDASDDAGEPADAAEDIVDADVAEEAAE